MQPGVGLEKLYILGARATILATPESSGEDMTIVLWEAPFQPNASSDLARRHVHTRETQHYRIVSGRMGFEVDGVLGEVAQGDSLTIRPGQRHRTWCVGPDVCVSVSVMRPGGIEHTLRALASQQATDPVRSMVEQSAQAAALVDCWNRQGLASPHIAPALAVPPHESAAPLREVMHRLLCSRFGAGRQPAHGFGPDLANALRVATPIETLQVLGDRVTILADGATTAGEWFIAVVDSAPRPARQLLPTHTHDREDQAYVVVEGCLAARIRGDFFFAGKGEMFTVPRGVPHAVWSVGLGATRFLMLTRPAGLELVYRFAASSANSTPSAADIARRFLEHGVRSAEPLDDRAFAQTFEDYRTQSYTPARGKSSSPPIF
jgi:mannose-6-phosphate isomerase-like protein (cupin superfamily)